MLKRLSLIILSAATFIFAASCNGVAIEWYNPEQLGESDAEFSDYISEGADSYWENYKENVKDEELKALIENGDIRFDTGSNRKIGNFYYKSYFIAMQDSDSYHEVYIDEEGEKKLIYSYEGMGFTVHTATRNNLYYSTGLTEPIYSLSINGETEKLSKGAIFPEDMKVQYSDEKGGYIIAD